jgi:predicted ATPase
MFRKFEFFKAGLFSPCLGTMLLLLPWHHRPFFNHTMDLKSSQQYRSVNRMDQQNFERGKKKKMYFLIAKM